MGVVHDGVYAAQAYWTCKWNFDLHPDDTMWCIADIGWITRHTYAFYGPLLVGYPETLRNCNEWFSKKLREKKEVPGAELSKYKRFLDSIVRVYDLNRENL